MLDFIGRKEDCTGCSACFNTCPVNCISMRMDEEGFLYPKENELCIQCGKCKDVCPLASGKTSIPPNTVQQAFAAVSNDSTVWQTSSSGGAFTEICRAFGDDNTAIFGAAFNALQVKHHYVIGCDKIAVFRKSKYVQSDIGRCYRDVLAMLGENRRVIFSGTPCQIAGLRSYLGRDYDRLLCLDFICHGVGSPTVFQSFLSHLETTYGSKIISYTFRVKNVIWGNFSSYVSRYVFANRKSVSVENDDYNRLFLQQLCLRPCCAEYCRFRTSDRVGDLTMGDFKNRNEAFPALTDYRNYSTIVVNSKKGGAVIRLLDKNMIIRPSALEHVRRFNPLFYTTTQGNLLRKDFFKDFSSGMNFQDLVRIYTTPPMRSHWVGRLKRMLPYKVKAWVRRIRSTR